MNIVKSLTETTMIYLCIIYPPCVAIDGCKEQVFFVEIIGDTLIIIRQIECDFIVCDMHMICRSHILPVLAIY
jgi:hypothetical protein